MDAKAQVRKFLRAVWEPFRYLLGTRERRQELRECDLCLARAEAQYALAARAWERGDGVGYHQAIDMWNAHSKEALDRRMAHIKKWYNDQANSTAAGGTGEAQKGL